MNSVHPISRPSVCASLRARPFQARGARRAPTAVRVAQVNQDQFEAEVLKEYKGAIKVVKVEHDANPKLIEEFKVYGLPALVLIKDGQLVPGSKREGAVTKALFVDWLKKNGITAPVAQ